METLLKVGLVVMVVVPLAISGAWLWNLVAQRRRTAGIRRRSPLSPEAFFATYYQSSGLPKEVVFKLLEDLERATGVPRTLLRPDDRLWEGSVVDESLFDSLHTVALETALQEISEQAGCRIELAQLETVDAYIRTLGPWEAKQHLTTETRRHGD
ncbi:MAG TPA: hypothetical protein VNK82_13865 [Terriglobales bacterium]|nr:hypothetical protein [Terriglobales bacterium]